MQYSADFETTTDPDDCRVWAWACCEIEDETNIWYGNCIETFIDFMKENQGEYYFHNAGFDSEFIFHYLLTNGYTYCEKAQDKGITLLMSQMRTFYQSKIYFQKNRKGTVMVTIKDSYKKLPFTVEKIAKDFHLPINKLEIDYHEYRAPGHELTAEEIEYITNDVQIIAIALRIQFEQGLKALTIGSDALGHLKTTFNFEKFFPKLPLEVDAEIRKAYKGGYTYAIPRLRGVPIGEGIVLDVNSMYPSMMRKPMPVGTPVYYQGKYNGDKMHIQHFWATAKLKPDHLPTVQLKKNPMFREHEYCDEIPEATEFYMVDLDMKLFFDHYDVDIVEWTDAYVFDTAQGMFDDYIYYWNDVKMKNTGAIRLIAKLMLNNPYGKLATNPDVTGRYLKLGEAGNIEYPMKEEQEFSDPVYTAAAAWITAYARDFIIRTAQRLYDRFVYCDTDSLHLLGTDIPDNLYIHDTALGAWALESTFEKAKYLGSKTYIDVVDGVNHVKCAGLRADVRDRIKFEEFNKGAVIPAGKLRPKHVPGGIVLVETNHTIR